MRGYKIIFIIAMMVYLPIFTYVNVTRIYRLYSYTIVNDAFLVNQLKVSSQMPAMSSVLVYGSSGLAYGVLAKRINELTGFRVLNMSTLGYGGQLDEFISLASKYDNSGKIVLLGDRGYRMRSVKVSDKPKIFSVLQSLSLQVNVVNFLRQSLVNRDKFGDLVNYPLGMRQYPRYLVDVSYSTSTLDLMKRHVLAARRAGFCPILVYVPLLVYPEAVSDNVASTEALNELVRLAGIENYVARTPMIETDLALFSDQNHLSDLGREKWTNLLVDEIVKRNLCDIVTRMGG
jgi:hypothetical protein